MVLELVEDLLHLEGGEHRLDQDRGPDGSPGDSERVLGVHEDVVPEPRLEMALELRQVEVGTAAAAEQFGGVVEEVEPEIEQAGGDRRAVEENVLLAPGASRAGRTTSVAIRSASRYSRPSGAAKVDGAADGVLAVALSGDHVLPGGRERILEVAHEDLRPGVEGVDHHLALHRAGDLDPAVVRDRPAQAPPARALRGR